MTETHAASESQYETPRDVGRGGHLRAVSALRDMGETSQSVSTKRRRAVKQGRGVLHPWQLQNCFQLVHIFKKQQNTSSLLVTGKPEEPIQTVLES